MVWVSRPGRLAGLGDVQVGVRVDLAGVEVEAVVEAVVGEEAVRLEGLVGAVEVREGQRVPREIRL